jgi:hypothetical protein
MIHTNIWKPDTCGCEIEYTWDDSVTQEERVHTFKKHNKVCNSHQNKSGEVLYTQVLGENQGKNKALGKITEHFPELTEDVKQGLVKWSFDANRKLKIEVSDKAKAAQIKIKLDSELGLGKVEVI